MEDIYQLMTDNTAESADTGGSEGDVGEIGAGRQICYGILPVDLRGAISNENNMRN